MILKNTKRIFIGIPLPEEVKSSIVHIKNGYPRLQSVRWTKSENLHITLVFIGDTSLEIIEQLKVKLMDLGKTISPFVLDFESLQIIKKNRVPVMFWAVYKKNKPFEQLYHKLSEEVNKSISLKKEHPKLIPHITITRIKQKEKHLPLLPADIILPEIVVNSIVLWESILLPEGPEYKMLKEIKLT